MRFHDLNTAYWRFSELICGTGLMGSDEGSFFDEIDVKEDYSRNICSNQAERWHPPYSVAYVPISYIGQEVIFSCLSREEL